MCVKLHYLDVKTTLPNITFHDCGIDDILKDDEK